MAETQVVTVAFTDLVGSTELSSRLDPDVGDRLRDAHFALLRGAIEANGGTEVKNLGDGLMVVFPVTTGALNGAEAMQQAIAHFNKRASEPLCIRVGLSHGEVTQDSGDYFGDAVVEAARLCAHADGGQILATHLVALTAGRRASQRFVSVGELELKGLPEPVNTVEVCWVPASEPAGPLPVPPRVGAAHTALAFVGREHESTILAQELKKSDLRRQRRIVMVGGEPGIGKTTLATTFARHAHDNGALVLYGRCDEDVGIPYQPWIEALSYLVEHAPDALLDEVVAAQGADLAPLGPALAALGGGGGGASDPETARYMLFGAVVALLQAAAREQPVVLVLDDLQWADVPTLRLLRYLASADQPMAVLVIGTYRESEVASGSSLADLLGRFHRAEGVTRISLKGLGDADVLNLLESAAGQTMDDEGLALRDALRRETDGNPFFVGELLRHLVETGLIAQGTDGHWRAAGELRAQGLPVSVREVVGERVARLGAEAERVLSIAAVIGRDFDVSVLALASDISVDALLDVLDAAVEATLVHEVPGNRYSFAHALVEHALYDALGGARKGRTHRRVAEAIEMQCQGNTEGRVGELAYHWAQATVPVDLERAVGYAKAAGDEALAGLAPDEAERWYSQALSLLGQSLPVGDDVRCRLLIGLGDSQRQMGRAAYRETLLEAAHQAHDLGATDLLAAAALANNRGSASAVGTIDLERVEVLEAACNALQGTESVERARLLALLASELTYAGDIGRRKLLVGEAVAVARQCGDPATLSRVLSDSLRAIDSPETLAERIALAAEGSEIAHRVGDPVLQFWGASLLSLYRYQAADVAKGDDARSVAQDLGERLGQPMLQWFVAFYDSARAMLAGDLAEAERLAVHAAELGSETGQPDAGSIFAAQFGVIRMMQGRGDEIIELLGHSVAENPGLPGFAMLLALLLCDLDRPTDARAVLAPFVADGFAGLPHDPVWLFAMGLASYAVAELDWVEAAEVLLERLRPFAGQIPYAYAVAFLEVNYSLGGLAAAIGRTEEADAFFSQAAASHERMGAAWGLAMTQLAWGRFLVTRGDPGDHQRASTLLEQALHAASTHGYALVERRAAQALEGLGQREASQ